ncbi:MAG TPA: penicillin-binding protein 2 [Mycobacteriales bacterium]|nr:penicillin-binding protein 2 [Mycobacteriales bacterium]
MERLAVSQRSTMRLFVLRVLVASILLTLFGRLWFLQVYAADTYTEAAAANRTREVVQPAARGEVYDATGVPLIRNRTALVVSVNRSVLRREPDRGAAVLARLAKVVRIPANDIARLITPCGPAVAQPCWNGSPYQPVPVKQYDVASPADTKAVLAIQEHKEDFPGVLAQFQAVRQYPKATLGAHVLGYLGPMSDADRSKKTYPDFPATALVGRTGVEEHYDAALHGRDGVQRLTVDTDGAVTETVDTTTAVRGDKLVLSVVASVQKVAEDALLAAVEKARRIKSRDGSGFLKADSGAVVVMEAKTGRVLALASYPSYDPAVFTGGVSTKEYAALTDDARGAPLINRPIQGLFAPASTFKVLSTAAAVESGHYPLGGSYPCPGAYAPLNGKRNFESRSLGMISLRTALVKSCDTIFYKFAYEQWQRDGANRPKPDPGDHMFRMAHAFGLAKRTGIDLPNEKSGRLEDRAFKKAFWEETKDDYCAGAKRRPKGSELQLLAEDQCRDGFRLRGGDAANFAIGQGNTVVTPLQLATVYAAIANGGTIVTPTVGRALLSPDGKRVQPIAAPPRGRVPVSAGVLSYIREALHGVTQQGGTAYGAFAGLPLAVAGKTGTAEVANKQDTSWFASFAPAGDASLVVVGMLSQAGTGGTVAAPMVAEVYRGIYGLEGRKAALPGGRLPAALPRVRPDGTVAPLGAKVGGPVPEVLPPRRGPALAPPRS